jgi:uncharacterized tellurite resistance protein B-like protein
MGWFNKSDKKQVQTKDPLDMSPVESVTYLCTAIQMADGQIDSSEKNIWIELITELFPEFSEERANNFFYEAQLSLNSKNEADKNKLIIEVLNRIKYLMEDDQIDLIGKKISDIVEADGIVMSGEVNLLKFIEKNLNIEISYNSEL